MKCFMYATPFANPYLPLAPLAVTVRRHDDKTGEEVSALNSNSFCIQMELFACYHYYSQNGIGLLALF